MDAYLSQPDTFPASGYTAGYIGSIYDPTFGNTSSIWMGQYLPTIFNVEERSFGENATIDSLMLFLFFDRSSNYGDSTKVQTFEIYELKHRFSNDFDSLYYMPLGIADLTYPTPLATFELSGSGSQFIRFKGEQADNLIARLMDESEGIYQDEEGVDSLFIDRCPGLYIKAAADSPKDASILPIIFEASQLFLYASRPKLEEELTEGEEPGDTALQVGYSFYSEIINLVQISEFSHDYTTGTIDASRINDTLPTSQTVDIGYVQGMAGVTTYLRFDPSFIERLRAKVTPPYTGIAINQAKLTFELNNPTPESMDQAITRAGLYHYYPNLVSILDYNYVAETDATNPMTIPYGGYLNRTHESYTVDLARVVQRMLNGQLPDDYTMTLAPSYGVDLLTPFGTSFKTGESADYPNPFEIVVTYTLLN